MRIHCLAMSILLMTSFYATAGVVETPRIGAFETTFSEKSPLVDAKTLQKRFKLKEAPAAFDLSGDDFLVYVPKAYDPSKPIGLIVLANYKHSDEHPTPILPQLDDANTALVVAKRFPDAWPERAALALHAAHNMKLLYAVDPRRVYVFGGGDPPMANGDHAAVAQRLSLCFADVFTGAFCTGGFDVYMPVKAANGGAYKAFLPRPDDAQIGLAKQHPLIYCGHDKDTGERYAAAFKQQGYTFFKYGSYTIDQLHYPNYTADWLPEVLAYLDSATAKLKLPTTKPAPAAK